MYASLAIVGFVAGCTFFLCFRKGRKWEGNAVILEAVPVDTDAGAAQGRNDMSETDKGI